MIQSPAEILRSAAARRGWGASDIAIRLAQSGVTITAATVRNWLTGRVVPADAHRLPLVALFGLERDGFLTACSAQSAHFHTT